MANSEFDSLNSLLANGECHLNVDAFEHKDESLPATIILNQKKRKYTYESCTNALFEPVNTIKPIKRSELESDLIDHLRDQLISVFKKDTTVGDWIQSYEKCAALLGNDIDVNSKLFPLSDHDIYKTIARTILLYNNDEPKIMIPPAVLQADNYKYDDDAKNEFDERCRRREKNVLHKLCDYEKWKILINDTMVERTLIIDEQVVQNLIAEIDDNSIYVSKDLYWLLSWSLRLTYARSNPMWKRWYLDDNAGFFNFSYFLHLTHSYKDGKLFDTIIKYMPHEFCQTTMSFSILNNMTLAHTHNMDSGIISKISLRMLPWPIDLTKKELLQLYAKCKIFPCAVVLGHMMHIDGFPMAGSTALIHDWFHTITFVIPSQVYLNSIKESERSIKTINNELQYWWDSYNLFVTALMDICDWTINEIDMLFYFIHELFGSAVKKCNDVLETNVQYFKNVFEKNRDRHDTIKGIKRITDPITLTEYEEFFSKLKKILMNVVGDRTHSFPPKTVMLSYLPIGLDAGLHVQSQLELELDAQSQQLKQKTTPKLISGSLPNKLFLAIGDEINNVNILHGFLLNANGHNITLKIQVFSNPDS